MENKKIAHRNVYTDYSTGSQIFIHEITQEQSLTMRDSSHES